MLIWNCLVVRTAASAHWLQDTLFHSKQWMWTKLFWQHSRFTWFTNWFSFYRLLCRQETSQIYQLSPEIKDTGWLLQVTWPVLTYYSVLFQHSVAMQLTYLLMTPTHWLITITPFMPQMTHLQIIAIPTLVQVWKDKNHILPPLLLLLNQKYPKSIELHKINCM